ncbi:alpha/beta hydrolase [Bacillus sp. 2205SS5-2]|uniref:alpha/beta hydrolase n=1 Tax=Bacillus sp. 2205SS5-2 TaxID=3109031 RepID=UPI003006E5C5
MSTSRGTVEEQTIFSSCLQEEISLLVYLPANYTPLYKYSLLIAQDGKDYFQLGRLPRLADQLLENDEIENTIIVGIPYKSVQQRRSYYHPDGEQNENYIRFIAHELVPFLDEIYPTYQMGLGRILIGDSLGATVSFLTALRYPNTFGKVILQSPYVDEKVFSAANEFSQPSLLDIYHIIGLGETEVKTTVGTTQDFLSPNRKLNELMKGKGFNYFYDEFDGDHTWKYWQPDLKRALKKML